MQVVAQQDHLLLQYQSSPGADLADEGEDEDRVCGAGDLSQRGRRPS